jgi:L-fuculose-phosphate aldolase
MEDYVGVKFKPKLTHKGIRHNSTKEIITAGKKLDAEGMVFVNAGNISAKIKNAFIITAAGSELNSLDSNDFAKVTACDLKHRVVIAEGKKDPSSESIMHHLIYKTHPNVTAVVHVHSGAFLNESKIMNSGFLSTNTFIEYGTLELAYNVVKNLGKENFIIIKGHGAIALGSSVKEATDLMINNYRLLKGLPIRLTDQPISRKVKSVDSELIEDVKSEESEHDENLEEFLSEEIKKPEPEEPQVQEEPVVLEEGFEEKLGEEEPEEEPAEEKVELPYEEVQLPPRKKLSIKFPKLRVKLRGFTSTVICPTCGTKKRFAAKSCDNCGYFYGIDKISYNTSNFIKIEKKQK